MCISIWADSLRSTNADTRTQARDALVATGGRLAVDALRADYEKAPGPASRMAVILSMGTTGSAEDIAFLEAQLRGPFVGNAEIWPATQAAATTLGLLRATVAHDTLAAVLARYGQSGFAGRAVAHALATLDQPPCADSVHGDPRRDLVRIVMQCGPESMWTGTRYSDAASGGIWSHSGDRWELVPESQAVTGATARVSETVSIAPGGRRAEVLVSTWCGSLCGEGWRFQLMQFGHVWRVVGAAMEWVS